jgi:leader peptidase (prepilin peptidase) / N-methyltransferase
MLYHHLPEIIWAGFLGLVMGNFLTSPLYRLPRGVPLSGEDPYCDNCHARLKPRDLFPVLSWILSRGKCRYCGTSITGTYAAVEIAICVLFIICYLQYGFSEDFLLVSFGVTVLLALLLMLTSDDYFSDCTLIVCIVLGMLQRTLHDGTIYGFAGTGFAGLLVGVSAWKLSGKPWVRDVGAFPSSLKLLCAAGVWLNLSQLAAVCVAAAAASIFTKERKWMPQWAIGTCTVLQVLIHT